MKKQKKIVVEKDKNFIRKTYYAIVGTEVVRSAYSRITDRYFVQLRHGYMYIDTTGEDKRVECSSYLFGSCICKTKKGAMFVLRRMKAILKERGKEDTMKDLKIVKYELSED